MEQLKIHDIYKIIDINDKFFTDNTPSLLHQESFLDLKKRSSIASMDQIVTSSSDKNIIGTTALDTCFGLSFTIELTNGEWLAMDPHQVKYNYWVKCFINLVINLE